MNHHPSLFTKPLLLAWPVRLLAAFLIGTLAVTLWPVVPQTAFAQDQQNEIKGIVVNGTEGSTVPEGLTVLLLTVDNTANQIIEQESTTVGADGTFSFGNLISGPGVTFRVVADAGDYTPSIDLSAVDDWSSVRLTIYDQTSSFENITVSSYVMMIPTIDAQSRQAGFLTVINVSNSGDKVWFADLESPELTGLDLLRFNLPDGFSDLSVESELPTGNIVEIPTGFAMTNPIPPGEAAILMSYIISYEGDGFDFPLQLPYGADQVRMLLPDGKGSITGPGLGSLESVVVAENVFNSAEGANYAVNEDIVITFSGLPQPTLLQTLAEFFDGRTYVIVIIWVVGIALLGILGYTMYSSRKGTDQSSEDDGELASRADIIAEIAALDEEFEAGKIDQTEYDELRGELKQLALELEDSDSPEPGDSGSGESEKPET